MVIVLYHFLYYVRFKTDKFFACRVSLWRTNFSFSRTLQTEGFKNPDASIHVAEECPLRRNYKELSSSNVGC
nr:hypothetical protein [uncultured bacterium]